MEVITTTMTTCGCRASTSTWQIVAVLSEGAETTAKRLVTWEMAMLVTRIASSTSLRVSDKASGRAGARLWPVPSILSTT